MRPWRESSTLLLRCLQPPIQTHRSPILLLLLTTATRAQMFCCDARNLFLDFFLFFFGRVYYVCTPRRGRYKLASNGHWCVCVCSIAREIHMIALIVFPKFHLTARCGGFAKKDYLYSQILKCGKVNKAINGVRTTPFFLFFLLKFVRKSLLTFFYDNIMSMTPRKNNFFFASYIILSKNFFFGCSILQQCTELACSATARGNNGSGS